MPFMFSWRCSKNATPFFSQHSLSDDTVGRHGRRITQKQNQNQIINPLFLSLLRCTSTYLFFVSSSLLYISFLYYGLCILLQKIRCQNQLEYSLYLLVERFHQLIVINTVSSANTGVIDNTSLIHTSTREEGMCITRELLNRGPVD